MKANRKGLGGIKHLILAHGEKLGIVIVGSIAAMMIFSSLTREKLPPEKEASKLKEQITLAKQSMAGFTWDRMKEEFPTEIRLVLPIEQKGTAIDPGAFVTNNSLNPPVVPPVVLRTDPVLLDPQGLEARGGSGLLAFVDPAVRRKKMLEEAKKAAEAAKLQKEEQQKLQGEEGRGGNRGNRGSVSEGNPYGAGTYDPAHPKRRAVVGMTRPRGVPLQDYEEVRVAHWAIVVAKVPIKEQLKLYRDAFKNARGYNPMGDIPQYLGYFVQRAEVGASNDTKDLKWEPVYVYNGKGQRIGAVPAVTPDTYFGKPEDLTTKKPAVPGVTTNWAAQTPEIVDSRFLEGGVLAFPLPPLVGRDWGAEMTHSEIPLAIDAVELEEDKKKTEKDKPKEPSDAEPADPFASGVAGGVAGGGRGPMMEGGLGGYGGRGGMGMGGEGRGGYGGGYGGGMPGGYGGMMEGGRGGYGGVGGYGGEVGYGGGGYGGRGGMGGSGLGQTGEPQAPHWLLRFIDFSVQPGKKYKYRVQLAMLDPNQPSVGHFVDEGSLDGAVIKRVRAAKAAAKAAGKSIPKHRLTEWSKPSGTVSIPLAGAVYVAGAKPATDGFNKEPSTTLLVESFGEDGGKAIQAAKKKEFKRGNVANMTEDAEVLADQGRAIDPFDNFKFQTNITIADIHGGERLTRDETRPARVLLMSSGGQLFVQDELTDLPTVEAHDATFAKEPPGGAAGGFMGEGGYGGGRGGMMGIEGGRGGGRQ